MKTRKPDFKPAAKAATMPWAWIGAAFAAVIFLFWAYGPTMNTAFLFDDVKQRFAMPAGSDPLSSWIGPVRPVLMLSYFVNHRLSPEDTGSYHLFNLLIHMLSGVLVYLVIRRLLTLAELDPGSRTPRRPRPA